MIGRRVTVIVDRPLGSCHPRHRDICYPVNYGYIPGVMAPDGEEQDAYILGVSEPVQEFSGKVIAVIHRFDDVEEKMGGHPRGHVLYQRGDHGAGCLSGAIFPDGDPDGLTAVVILFLSLSFFKKHGNKKWA